MPFHSSMVMYVNFSLLGFLGSVLRWPYGLGTSLKWVRGGASVVNWFLR